MSRTTSGGFRRGRRVADSMTPEFHRCVDHGLAAERAGDLAAALEWHLGVPMFRRGRHQMMLRGLVGLGDPLPEWVWARLLAYLAMRCEDGATGRLVKTSLRPAVEAFHDELMDLCHQRRGDPIKVLARVGGESWVIHQSVAHEDGVLLSFIDEFATGRLAEHADLARSWASARLSGYQLGESRNGRLCVKEASDDRWIEVLDLGARSCTSTGWVLGRLVPTGDGGHMFDRPPLGVPADIAAAVAEASADWRPVVHTAILDGRLRQLDVLREDYELTCDVPELELLRFATPDRDFERVMMQLREGRDEISRAGYRVLARARRGDLSPADAPYVAAALLNVRAFDTVRHEASRSAEASDWSTWVPLLPEPARRRARELVTAGRSAA